MEWEHKTFYAEAWARDREADRLAAAGWTVYSKLDGGFARVSDLRARGIYLDHPHPDWLVMYWCLLAQRPVAPEAFDPPLDPGIAPYVILLRSNGVETYESCRGGEGHAYAEPAVRFHGGHPEGFRALAVAMQHGLPVSCLRRVWRVEAGEPTGPSWELVFWRTADER